MRNYAAAFCVFVDPLTPATSPSNMFLGGAILLSLACAFSVDAKCPPVEAIAPSCVCRTHFDKSENYDILSCYDLESEDELRHVLEATDGYKLFELEVVDSTLRFLPQDAFLNATFQIISIRNSSLSALSSSGVALEGLEGSLRLLEVINCTFEGDWTWKPLERLHRLEEVHVSDAQMEGVAEGVATIGHLQIDAFVLQKNGIAALGADAFAPFESLERLALDNNFISEVKRSMFPSPATSLKILGLGYNNLRELPWNIFNDMPSLKSLYLTGNPLYTIEERVFRPIWPQLHNILVDGTRISCDCSIAWITRQDNRGKFLHGECQRPLRFKGRMLETIKMKELWCDRFSEELVLAFLT